MDPASFSFAVVGMFLTCCKGYEFLANGKNAPSDAQEAARRVIAEYHVLGTWAHHFDLRSDLSGQQQPERLKFLLSNDHAMHGVFNALCTISETFTDIKRLDKKYAATKASEEAKKVLQTSKYRMSLLMRVRWSVRDKSRNKHLIGRLEQCNNDLLRLCHFEGQAQINRALAPFVLEQYKNSEELYKLADLNDESAQDKSSLVAAGREELAVMARFKARLLRPSKVADKYQARCPLLDPNDYSVRSSSHSCSMGTSLRNQHPIFVEWQSYRGKDGRPNRRAEDQIIELGSFLCLPDRPDEFRGLDCVGLFKDARNDRYGVVYDLPAHLRNAQRPLETQSRSIYNPDTLTSFMRRVNGIADLGDRFDLAKKLIRSVVALHACGWLHKNICPENVFFFAPRPLSRETISASKKDFTRPVIVGYGLSRPDDITDEGEDEDPQISRAPPRRGHDGAFANENSIYQHPDKASNHLRRFRHSYDIYSMGLVLLELGLWQSLEDLPKFPDPYKLHQYVLKRLVPDLWSQCGKIYGEVVRECLTINTNDAELADSGQRNLALKLAERLDQCVA
ncbi:MAG: hypothetical protein Q9168_006947 [Polycauliona sp. 1 TL-2023]